MRRKLLLSVCASCLLSFAAGGLAAQVAHQAVGPLGALAFSDARLRPAPAIQPLEAAEPSLATEARAAWALFQAASPVRWQAYVDQRTGQLDSAVGGGIRWIAHPGDTTLEELEKTARDFFSRLSALLGVDAESLVLDRGRSGRQADHLWYVDFNVRRAGLTIEGARVVFRVSHGNLIEIGAESLPAPGAEVPAARLTREQAQAAVEGFVRGFDDFDGGDSFSDPGSLHLLPVEEGDGRGLALVWQLVFRRRSVAGTWRARVDAATGEVLELLDVNRYGRVSGGAFADSPTTGPETLLPMPFADVGAGFADSAGFFSGPLPVTSELDGRYVKIADSCGAISKGSDWKGDVEFGSSAGTDCAVPGAGGSGGHGDTHAARTQYYHVNRIKEAGRAWLPGNAWLQGQLTVNVNLSQTCNAYWDGLAINFFKSGNGCGNTGELAGVSLHEYGHGLDENDGNGPAPDFGTGETYGDFTSALATHSSCIGSGFRSVHCGGYGDACTACTGVRDIDWAKHAAGTPATVDGFTRQRCPLGGGYDGPCGREGHCESYVASEALWDFTSRDLSDPGSAGAWTIGERLWYLSRATATAAFTCSTAVVPWTSSGCATGSLWRTMRAADDDDGNLTNGTPHSCQLYAAFNRHNIACPSDPGANVCFSVCTPPPVPTLTLTPGVGQVQVSWTSSGAGVVYDVYRSELGCNAGFVRVAGNVASTGYLDTSVAGGLPYSYQVVAHPASGGLACAAAPTACQAATPTVPACTPPAVPTGVTAAGVGISRIDLSWAAVGGAAGYNVYRAASPAGPYTLRASVAAPALSFSDTGLAGGATSFYKVRSYAAACESADSAAVPASTVPCVTVPLYRADFETGSGLAGWTASVLPGGSAANDWRGIQACAPARSGSSVFRFGAATCGAFYGNGEIAAVAPPAVAVLAAGTGNTRLSFWHRRSFEEAFDGGRVGASVDGGGLVFAPDAALSGETYDGAIAGPGPGTCPPGSMGGASVFTGTRSALAETVVDLDALCDAATGGTGGCAGHTVRPHFVAISDCFQGGTGWFLDDVQVTTCVASTGALDYYTLAPCRLVDTRNPAGPLGGPALAAGAERTFALSGACGIPAAAKALSINLTVVQPGGPGFLQALPGGAGASLTSAINFTPGSTRANNLLLTLAYDGSGTVLVRSGASLPVDFLLDVTGYFQ